MQLQADNERLRLGAHQQRLVHLSLVVLIILRLLLAAAAAAAVVRQHGIDLVQVQLFV